MYATPDDELMRFMTRLKYEKSILEKIEYRRNRNEIDIRKTDVKVIR